MWHEWDIACYLLAIGAVAESCTALEVSTTPKPCLILSQWIMDPSNPSQLKDCLAQRIGLDFIEAQSLKSFHSIH